MARRFYEIAFTEQVKQAQREQGVRDAARRMESTAVDDTRLDPDTTAFIAQRDSFYMASVMQNGWPYLQHRGGPPGFVKRLDDRTLAFADYGGNRQLLSTGNLRGDDRSALFFMDYALRARLKLLARVHVHQAEDRPELVERVQDPGYRARVERVFVLHVEALDWNCPQHITPRYTEAEWEAIQRVRPSLALSKNR
ncbi:MAG: phosphatase [Planctomycetota bacterium]|nr:MAG: phosphatase [Planctomycetota bacterium]